MSKARVLNIERCSTEDGPGIRTTVFLKGCHMRCIWCSNPESQEFNKEILLEAAKCVGCKRCLDICENKAISVIDGFGAITDSGKCKWCMKCVDKCWAGARVVQGEDMTADQLVGILEKDESYYRESGGGITFSGGEPCIYADFISECAQLIHERGYTVLVETCGYVDEEKLKKVSEAADIIYCDFKHYDPIRHKELTGVSNEPIISNIRWLDEHFEGELELRYPYIPGYNSSEECIERFLEFAQSLKHVKNVVFLPFHSLGADKYRGLGRKYSMQNMRSLRISEIAFLKDYEDKYDLNVSIY